MKCVNCENETNHLDEMANYCDVCYELKSFDFGDRDIEKLNKIISYEIIDSNEDGITMIVKNKRNETCYHCDRDLNTNKLKGNDKQRACKHCI